MLRLAADENFDHDIVRGVLRHRPDRDIVRVQDVGLRGADDMAVLVWAASDNRVLLTHDVTTMTKLAYERVQSGQCMAGVIEIGLSVPVGLAIEDILLLAEYSLDNEWEGQVLYLPL
jgi:hypothetical protein